MSQSDTRVDVLCEKCGAIFSAFLEQMAAHNQKVVCPNCGQAQKYGSPQAQPPSRKTSS